MFLFNQNIHKRVECMATVIGRWEKARRKNKPPKNKKRVLFYYYERPSICPRDKIKIGKR
jgi:hypothetical protein